LIFAVKDEVVVIILCWIDQDVAAIFDWFYFIMLLIVTSIITLAAVLAILIGAITA
jgi:hypothetical protein